MGWCPANRPNTHKVHPSKDCLPLSPNKRRSVSHKKRNASHVVKANEYLLALEEEKTSNLEEKDGRLA